MKLPVLPPVPVKVGALSTLKLRCELPTIDSTSVIVAVGLLALFRSIACVAVAVVLPGIVIVGNTWSR